MRVTNIKGVEFLSLNNFEEIQIAYSKTFYNACELLEESQLLLNNNRNARAYLLAHIAIEELARCIMLSSAIMKFKIRALDVKKLIKRQTNHQSKIELAYSFVKKLEKYKSPLSVEDKMETMHDFFKINSETIISENEIKKLNNLKNASFYVDQYQNVTKSPSEIISTEKAKELVSSAMLLKEFIEFTTWHENENLINIAKKTDNELLLIIKNIIWGDEKKI